MEVQSLKEVWDYYVHSRDVIDHAMNVGTFAVATGTGILAYTTRKSLKDRELQESLAGEKGGPIVSITALEQKGDEFEVSVKAGDGLGLEDLQFSPRQVDRRIFEAYEQAKEIVFERVSEERKTMDPDAPLDPKKNLIILDPTIVDVLSDMAEKDARKIHNKEQWRFAALLNRADKKPLEDKIEDRKKLYVDRYIRLMSGPASKMASDIYSNLGPDSIDHTVEPGVATTSMVSFLVAELSPKHASVDRVESWPVFTNNIRPDDPKPLPETEKLTGQDYMTGKGEYVGGARFDHYRELVRQLSEAEKGTTLHSLISKLTKPVSLGSERAYFHRLQQNISTPS